LPKINFNKVINIKIHSQILSTLKAIRYYFLLGGVLLITFITLIDA